VKSVHNLVDEYIEEYLFSSLDGDGNKIKIKVINRNSGDTLLIYSLWTGLFGLE
jgi:hypothetical protein